MHSRNFCHPGLCYDSCLQFIFTTFTQIALISVENKKMEISHKLFTSWLNDLTLIGSEDVIKEILRRNLQKFHSLFCKALGLLQGTFPSMLAPRFVSAATSLIRFVPILPSGSNHLRFYNGFIEIMRHCEDENEFIRVFLYRFAQTLSLSLLHVMYSIFFIALPGHFPGTFSTTTERSLWTCWKTRWWSSYLGKNNPNSLIGGGDLPILRKNNPKQYYNPWLLPGGAVGIFLSGDHLGLSKGETWRRKKVKCLVMQK